MSTELAPRMSAAFTDLCGKRRDNEMATNEQAAQFGTLDGMKQCQLTGRPQIGLTIGVMDRMKR